MNYHLISDTHFGHTKIIEYEYRPADYGTLLLENLSQIPPEDTLIHLGDFCISNDKMWHMQFVTTLCRKILVRGNHDKKTDTWYLEHGWDFVCDSFSLNKFGKKILFTHKPVEKREDFDVNIHGHMHSKIPLSAIDSCHRLIAVEYTDYKPVLLRNTIENRQAG